MVCDGVGGGVGFRRDGVCRESHVSVVVLLDRVPD